MPVYLAHGFRWARGGLTGIRVHVIFNNIEDMPTEYLQSSKTTDILLRSLLEVYASIMERIEDPRTGRTLHFLEQYDPLDESGNDFVGQEYAFVADRVITMAAGGGMPTQPRPALGASENKENRPKAQGKDGSQTPSSTTTPLTPKPPQSSSSTSSALKHLDPTALSLNIDEVMSSGPAVTPQAWEAFAELRDKLAEGEKIGWWIIYNGDPERKCDDSLESDMGSEDDYDDTTTEEGARTPTQAEPLNILLGKSLPSIIPPDLLATVFASNDTAEQSPIGMAIPHPPPPPPPPPLERPPAVPDGTPVTRPKSSRSFTAPLRKKLSRANLSHSRKEEIPDLPKLKEIGKKEGFMHKFFGRGTEKK